MRFHKIELKNLNSIYGEHTIDLEAGRSPLFLIKGPTGAGKTTILDAICLALFENAPRLKDEGDRRNRAERILSHGTSKGFAEVTFSSRIDGERELYRAKWKCWRSDTGNMQQPKRGLEHRESEGEWTPLATEAGKQEFKNAFQEQFGDLTLDSFTRSIMLAQGEFSAFLDANEEQKAEILESLTDSDRYKRIGEQMMEKWRSHRDKIQRKESELESLDEVDEEEIEKLEEQKTKLEDDIEELDDELETKRDWLNWLKRQSELDDKIDDAEKLYSKKKERWEQNQDQFDKLERAKAADKVRDVFQSLDDLEEASQKRRDEFECIGQQVEQLDAGLVDDVDVGDLDGPQEPRGAVDVVDTDEPSVIQSHLRSEVNDAKATLEQLKSKIEDVADAEDAIEEHREKRDERTEALESAEESFDELKHLAPLGEKLYGLTNQVETLGKKREVLESKRDELEKAQSEREELESNEEELLSDIERLEETVKDRREAYEETQAKVDSLLGDADDVDAKRTEYTSSREEIQNQISLVKESKNKLKTWNEKIDEKEKLETEIEKLEEQIQEENETLESLGEEVLPELKEKKQKLDTELEELNRKLRFADVRDELVEGEPCPVCGADEHPYRTETPTEDVSEDDRQRRDDVSSELDELAGQISDKKGKRKALQNSLEKAKQQLEDNRSELEDLEEDIDDTREAFNSTLSSIDVEFDDDLNPAEKIEVAEKSLGKRKEQIDDEERALLDAKQHRDDAKEAYDSKVEKLEDARDSYKEWEEKLEQFDEDIEDIEDEMEALEAELGDQATELIAQFDEVGIDVDWSEDNLADISGFEDALAEAEDQYKSFESAKQKVEDLVSRIDEVQTELDSHIQSWEYAWERLRETYDESGETIRRIDKLENNLRDELNTWVEESEYFESIDGAKQALLDESDLEELEQLCDKLEDELEEAEDNLEKLKEQRTEHGKEKPEQLDPEEAERSEIEDEVEKLSDKKSEKSKKVGELTSELEQKEKILKKRSDKQEELEALEERKQNIVDPMYELVGKSDGDKFKRFVQALNLQKIVVQANQYLESLRDRYRLDVATDKHGFPELDFSVIDRFHGGRKRDPGTLSGGETFLVSLSLALALADQRHLNLPIETLFLDEGFGTLDQDALDTAVNTLNQLHHTLGRTVGIISHVSGLAEKIHEHIVVRKCGEGRSTIDMAGFYG